MIFLYRYIVMIGNSVKFTIPNSVSLRSFCKRGHNGLFKILGGRHVVWACETQIPRGDT